MRKRKDYISECMDDTGVETSIDKFMEAFCSRCLNSECQRSAINDLKWQQRMERQVQALNNPDFADPNDPDFRPLADQNFVSFEKETVTVDTWEHFEGVDKRPARFQKEQEKKKGEPVVHKAEPPTQHHEGDKIDRSVNQLAASRNGEEIEEPEPPPVASPVTSPKGQDQKEVASGEKTRYNTDVPEGGIMLEHEGAPPPPKKATPPKDAWAIPDKGDKTLVVRADTGEVVEERKKPDKDD